MSSPSTSNTADLEQTFLTHLPRIERIIAAQARRNSLSTTDAEEFESWTKEQLIDKDYAILRKFSGRSSLPTYLTTVIVHLLSDFRNAQWGRWRPSAAATRAGPMAVQLEKMIFRDGLTTRDAITSVRTAHPDLDEHELFELVALLPRRDRREDVDLDAAVRSNEMPRSEHGSATAEREGSRVMIEQAIESVIAELPPEDAAIVRMHYWNGWSVADIARTLRLDQPPLYKRIKQMHGTLRAALERRGIDRAVVTDLVGGPDDQ